jgi:hypothetical protein
VDFSRAQFESLLAEISAGMTELTERLGEIGPAASAAANRWYVPAGVADAIIWLAEKTLEIGREMLELFTDVLRGAAAPIYMFLDAWEWMDVKGTASGVASTLTTQNLTVDDSDWSGKARDAYVGAVAVQSGAAARISGIAGSTSGHLLACAAAGAAFYATLAVVLAKLIAATIAAIVAFGSAVFSWAGAAIVLEEAGVNTAIIATAVATLTAFLTAQATTMVNLHGEAVDQSSFPGGKWPSANTSTYSTAP